LKVFQSAELDIAAAVEAIYSLLLVPGSDQPSGEYPRPAHWACFPNGED
jgi:hypothetical protein